MPLITVLVLLIALPPPLAHAHRDCLETKCEETRQKIRKTEARMRQGYGRAKGERLRRELRSLKAIRAKVCR